MGDNESLSTPTTAAAEDDHHQHHTAVTPLPWLKVGTISIVLFCNSFLATLILPFVAFMVADWIDNKDEVAVYSGYMLSAFMFGQLLGSTPWGILSDRIGRRPVLLLGLMGTSASCLMFGFSTSYYHALFLRFLTGLLNGVVGVSKTYIAEICDETNQSKAFSLLGLNRALGLLVGPALGGFLSYPSHQWPQLFPLGSLFDKFPYALPTTVGFLIACCGLTCSFFVLEETRIWHIQEEEEVEGEICAPPSPASLPDPSIGVSVGNTSMSTLPDEEMPATLQEEVRECDPAEHTPLLQNDHCSSSYTNSTSSTPVLQPVPDNNNHTTANTSTAAVSSAFETVKRMFLDKSIFYSVFIYNCIQFFFVIYDEAFVLWARMPVNDGGIGWEPDEIGTAFSAAGIVLLFYQLFIYHNIERRIGPLWSFRMGVLMAIPAFLMISRAGFFLDPSLKDAKDFNSSKLVWILVYLCQTIRTVSSLSAFTSCFIMIANSAPNELRGSVNGIAQSLGSLAQMAGPILGGNVFSFSLEIHHPSNETTADFSYWIDLHLIFYLLTACALTTFFISLKVPASVIKRRF